MLDERVSSALYRLRTLERAVHDAGPWSIVIEGVRHPATRVVTASGVVFTATVPHGKGRAKARAVLECRDEFISVADVDTTTSATELSWTLNLAPSA